MPYFGGFGQGGPAAPAGGAGGGGGMPLPVAAPLIGAGVGAAANYFGGKGAQRAQERANTAALAFEREREQTRRREYEENRLAQQRQFEAREQGLSPYRQAAASVLSYYGIPVDMPQAAPPDVAAQGMGGPPGGPMAAPTGPPMNLGQLSMMRNRRPMGY